MNTQSREQRLLLLSACATLFMSAAGVATGLWTGARAIVFDGMYSVVDAGMTLVAWYVTRLIARGDDRRFQYGYWHLEPLLALLNGAMLVIACIYGFVDGAGALVSGGRVVDSGVPVVYAAVSMALDFGVYAYLFHQGRNLNSPLLKLDARSWLLGGILSGGLLASFAVAGLLEAGGKGSYAAFADPTILILLALCMVPFPLMTIFKAGMEILQVAPPDLDASVTQIAEKMATRHGFIDYRSHVTRTGRAQFIEIGFLAPSAETGRSFGELDNIRQEIADAMGGLQPGCWLSVEFTADSRWI